MRVRGAITQRAREVAAGNPDMRFTDMVKRVSEDTGGDPSSVHAIVARARKEAREARQGVQS